MKAKIGRPKLTEAYKPLQISVPARLHEELKQVVKHFVKNNPLFIMGINNNK